MNTPTKNGREGLLRKKEAEMSTFLFGRIPPQARDLEEAVLGVLMSESIAFEQVSRLLRPEVFYLESHQLIYSGIVKLKEKGLPCDFISVTQFLRDSGELENVGGSYYITELTNGIASVPSIEHHAFILFQKFIQRELIRISANTCRDAFEDTTDPFVLKDKITSEIESIMAPIIASREVPLKKQLKNMVTRIAEAKDNTNQHTLGYPSGFPTLDAITNGFVPGDLNIIAARSGHGKTSMALCIAKNLIMQGVSTDIYSLETSDMALLMKFASAELGIPYTSVQRGNVDWPGLLQFESDFGELPLTIHDTTNVMVEDLVARSRLRKRQAGVKCIIVDYIQLLKSRSMAHNANREQEVATISRSLKALAKDDDVAVIALSQLKRTLDERGDKRPLLADLRESGAIENDSDKIIFLSRPAHNKVYYDSDGYSTAGVALIDVAKNRNGAVNQCKLQWHPDTTTFTEFQPGWVAEYEPTAVTRKRKKEPEHVPIRDFTEPEKDEEKQTDLPF